MFSVIFSERKYKKSSRRQSKSHESKKKDDEIEIIVPPSMRKSQKPVTELPDIQEEYVNLSGKNLSSNVRGEFLDEYKQTGGPGNMEHDIRDDASSSSLDTDVIQPSNRTHIRLKSLAETNPSLCLERTRTLESRLHAHGQESTGLIPSTHDRSSHSYLDKSPDFFHDIKREVRQIICENKSRKSGTHVAKKEARDDDTNEVTSESEVIKQKVVEIEPPGEAESFWCACW